jgi:Na+-driven multidrug efflux pump
LPLAFVLSKYTPLAINGIWYAFPITNIITAFTAVMVFRSGKWKKKHLTEDDKLTSEITSNVQSEEIIPYDA